MKMNMFRKIALLAALGFIVSGCSLTNQFQRQFDRISGSPEVQSISPENGATNVALDAMVEVTFTEDMDESTLNAKGVVISYANEDLVVFLNPFLNSKYEYDAGAKKLMITPAQKFIPGQQVNVTLTEDVKSAEGEQLPTGTDATGSERYVFSFTTQPAAGEQDEVGVSQVEEDTPSTEEVQNASFDELAAENLVKDFMLTKSETYKYDGQSETLKIEKIRPVGCVGCFDVVVSFISTNQGYGDRSDVGLESGETFHEGLIVIENGEIIEASLDETWDMITQQSL